MNGKIVIGLIVESITLIVIIAVARDQGVTKAEYWSHFEK